MKIVPAGLVAFALSVMLHRELLAAGEWDKTLPSLVLEGVHLEGKSLADTWTQIGQRFLLRTVLVSVDWDAGTPQGFSFTSDRCQASGLLDALVATYPTMTWTQDPKCGVIWIHPRSMLYASVLQTQIDIPSDELGLPVQDGVLGSLAQVSRGSLQAPLYNAPGRNTLNYTVNLTAGTYTVRDILNRCCCANPSKTFCVDKRLTPRDQTTIHAVNLVSLHYRNAPPSPGALQIWRLGVGPIDEGGPTIDVIRQKLADPDQNIRSSAREYIEAELFKFDVEGRTIQTSDAQMEAWDLVAAAEILCRLERFTFSHGVERLHVLASDESLLTWPPELAVLAASELARLGHDTHALDVLARREFKPGELANVRSRLHAIARMSPEVRDKLRGVLGQKLAAADASLASLADIRPNPPRSLGPTSMPSIVEFKLHEATQTQPTP